MARVQRAMLIVVMVLGMIVSAQPPVIQAAQITAPLDNIQFRWSPNYGGSLLVTRCVRAQWNWLMSTELLGDNNNPDNDRRLGAWKWRERGCRTHYAAVNFGEWSSIEIGIGASDSEPIGDLFQQSGTQIYEVQVSGREVSVRSLRTITPQNSWCPRGNCTFRNPAGTACEHDAQRLGSTPVYSGSTHFADVFIVWSPACQAVWGKAESRWEYTRFFLQLQFMNDRRGGRGVRFDDLTQTAYAQWTNMASQNQPSASVCAHLAVDNTGLEGNECAVVP